MSRSNDRKEKFLRDAVRSRDLSWVKALLQNHVDPNTVIEDGQTALHYICYQDELTMIHLKMIRSFIQYGADVDIQNMLGDSPIITLYRQAEDCQFRLRVYELLLREGADVTCVDRVGNTVLHWIVRKKKNRNIVETVELSLKSGLDVNIQNTMGQSALQVAIKYNSRNLEIVELLLRNGAHPSAVDNDGWTALNIICAHSKLEKVHLKMIKRLIEHRADVNIPDKKGCSPIMTLYNGANNFKLRLDIFKLLLEAGADVTFVDNAGDTILHLILCNKENPNIVEAVKLSLEYGLDVNIQNEKGQSALHLASLHCECIKVVKLLLKNGADPNVVDNDGWTALNYICANPTLKVVNLKMIQLLIQYTADVNIQNVFGDSPIMSLYFGEDYNLRFKVFSLLLEAGADVTYLNEGGNTMFHIILYNPEHQSVTKEMEVLLKSRVNVHTQNKKGYSALHFAAFFSEPLEVFEQLLKNRADPNAVDENGQTALHYICYQDKLTMTHFKMIELLIEYRADVNIANKDGERPIMALYYNGAKDFKLRLDVFKLLLKVGADVTHVNLEGDTILNYILYNGKDPNIIEAVELSLNHGCAVNIKNKLGQSALHFAVTFSQSLEVIKLLLERDANPNTVDNNDRTAMNYICLEPGMKKVNYKMIKTLIENDANVNIHDNFGHSPITNLFALGDCLVSELRLCLKAFRLLLQKGAVCQRSDVFGRYVSYNFDEADPLGDTSDVVKEVQYLLKTGMNVNKRDKKGRSPLHKAICELRIEHVQFLFRNGADPNIVDAYGNIPLNYTFKRFEHADMTSQFKIFLRILELNIKFNADLSHIGSNGKTVLHLLIIKVSKFFLRPDKKDELAKVSKYVLQYIKILLKHGLEYGLNVNIKDRDGFTPLNEAVSHCNYRIAQFLVKHGADVNTVNFKGGFLENKVFPSLNLVTTLNLLDIIELLQGKKFEIKSEQYLTLFKYLTLYENFQINDRRYSEILDVWATTDPSTAQCFFYDVYQLGSGSEIRKFVETLIHTINGSPTLNDSYKKNVKKCLYANIQAYLHLTKYGPMYVDSETKNYLQEKLDTLVSDFWQPETDERYKKSRDQLHQTLKIKLDLAKTMMIGNSEISILDLCTFGPDKTYSLLKNCGDYESVIYSDTFSQTLNNNIGGFIMGYITKALVRRLILKSIDRLKLTQLPILCFEKIMECLDTTDLVSVYKAAELQTQNNCNQQSK